MSTIMPVTRAKVTSASLSPARLARIKAPVPVVVSCYVRLLPEDRRKQGYLVLVKRRFRELDRSLAQRALTRDEMEEVRRNCRGILEWLAKPDNLPPAHGAALFASERNGLFEVAPLMRVLKTRVDIDNRPLLRELLAAQETLGRYLLVGLDRTHARWFDVSAVGATELPGVTVVASRGGKFHGDRRDAPGWGERDYHHWLEAERHRHYATIATETTRLMRTGRFAGFAVAGPTDHVAAFQPFLPIPMIDRLLGVARLNPKAMSASDAYRVTWALQLDHERRLERSTVERIDEGLGTGWAVNGLGDTLKALGRGQLRTLVVPVEQGGQGFRCASTGRLVLGPTECRGEGTPGPVANLIDQAMEDALEQGVEVVVIDDSDPASRLDGLAGILRFR